MSARYLLRLEILGNEDPGQMRMWKRFFQDPAQRRRWVYHEPWVAVIVAVSPSGGLKRRFLDASCDYTEANETGSRGIFKLYWLAPGSLYEVSEVVAWQKERRWFCHIQAEQLVRMPREEAIRRLTRNGEEPSP